MGRVPRSEIDTTGSRTPARFTVRQSVEVITRSGKRDQVQVATYRSGGHSRVGNGADPSTVTRRAGSTGGLPVALTGPFFGVVTVAAHSVQGSVAIHPRAWRSTQVAQDSHSMRRVGGTEVDGMRVSTYRGGSDHLRPLARSRVGRGSSPCEGGGPLACQKEVPAPSQPAGGGTPRTSHDL